jgi:CubicO group peptidase (beta-lactamase class C family)
MNKRSIPYGIILFIALFRLTQCSNTEYTPLKTTVPEAVLIAQLETEIPYIMEKAMIPGLSIAVVRDGRIIWSRGFGVRSAETQEAVTDETIYEACSLSKPVFAYEVMKLVETGRLDLDKPLIEYAGDAYTEETFLGGAIEDDRIRRITPRMVLSHTPGFPNWRQQRHIRIDFEPGQKFSYSGEGFVFLQRIVEKITGESLNDLMQKEVFGPLGMTRSSYLWKPSFDSITSYPHTFFGKALLKYKPERAVSAASLQTTAVDFARFMMAIMNHEGLNEGTVAKILTSQVVVDLEETEDVSWGLGIGLETTRDGIVCWHWGDNENFKCFTLAYPEQKIGVVYFTNSYFGLAAARRIVEASVGGDHPVFKSNLLADYGDVDHPGMQFVRILVQKGVPAAVDTYLKLRDDFTPEDIMSENTMNGIGYALLRTGRIDDAVGIFTLNVESFPESFNVYDSLGEAYMKKGEKELAVRNYERSLELNPDNTNGREMLEKLRNG